VERDVEPAEPVALRAEKDGRVLSWDTHPVVAESLKLRLESEGWQVSISTAGPRRRILPRIDRPSVRWRP
jgi:hypothetical protein